MFIVDPLDQMQGAHAGPLKFKKSHINYGYGHKTRQMTINLEFAYFPISNGQISFLRNFFLQIDINREIDLWRFFLGLVWYFLNYQAN